jgi:hypothetical protein
MDMDIGTALTVIAFITVLCVHSVMLGRWGGKLTERVKANGEAIAKAELIVTKLSEEAEERHHYHEERLRKVEDAVIRFEAALDRQVGRG